MKTVLLGLLSAIICVLTATPVLAQYGGKPFDFRKERPVGKNWLKITEIHYMDKSSVKKVYGEVYQTKLCIDQKKMDMRYYFDVRVDCSSRKSWVESEDGWKGPMDPSYFEKAVIDEICQ